MGKHSFAAMAIATLSMFAANGNASDDKTLAKLSSHLVSVSWNLPAGVSSEKTCPAVRTGVIIDSLPGEYIVMTRYCESPWQLRVEGNVAMPVAIDAGDRLVAYRVVLNRPLDGRLSVARSDEYQELFGVDWAKEAPTITWLGHAIPEKRLDDAGDILLRHVGGPMLRPGACIFSSRSELMAMVVESDITKEQITVVSRSTLRYFVGCARKAARLHPIIILD